jgi:hypothetical protein
LTGREVTFDPRTPTDAVITTINPGGYFSDIACPTVIECVAVDLSNEVTFDPQEPTPRYVVDVDPAGQLIAVACPSQDQCTALSTYGTNTVVTFDPTSPEAPMVVPIYQGAQYVNGLACPSDTECTIVDSSGRDMTFNPQAPSVSSPVVVDAGSALRAVACLSEDQCVAVDASGGEVGFNPVLPTPVTPVTIDGGNALTDVACVSDGQCTAVDVAGQEVTFDPASPGSAIPVRVAFDTGLEFSGEPDGVVGVACGSASVCAAADLGGEMSSFDPLSSAPVVWFPNSSIAGLACPSAALCVAVGSGYQATVTGSEMAFDPGTQTTASRTQNNQIDPHPLESVSCPSETQCTAVDDEGDEVTFDPLSLGSATIAGLEGDAFDSVSCPVADQCTAVDIGGREITFDPQAPTPFTFATIDRGVSLSSVACPSAGLCIAVDQDGRAVEGDPDVGSPWTIEPITGAASLSAVSCPSLGLCVVVDSAGDAFVGSEASSPSPAPASAASPTSTPAPPTPTLSGPPTKPGPSASLGSTLAVVVRATVKDSVLALHVACPALAGNGCSVAIDLSALERVKGGRVVGVNAFTTIASTERVVLVGHKLASLRAGHSKLITVKLTATGDRLLIAFHKLPVQILVRSGTPIYRKTVTFKLRA